MKTAYRIPNHPRNIHLKFPSQLHNHFHNLLHLYYETYDLCCDIHKGEIINADSLT